jgi:hypothetical protein
MIEQAFHRYNCRHGYRPVRTNLPTSPLAITVQPPVLCNGLPATNFDIKHMYAV